MSTDIILRDALQISYSCVLQKLKLTGNDKIKFALVCRRQDI